jgi:nifR3 family TIM-barrel protein
VITPQKAGSHLFSIGGVAIASPVVQAALSGYSDRAMRVLARRHGAAYSLGEVLLDQFVAAVGTNRRNLARLAVADEEHPVGGQLMGSNPDDFPPAAQRLVAEGYDVIDINFGCPVKKVLGRCRGGYLLSQPAIALEIVAKVREAVPPHVPVTLKMRRGLDDTPESLDNFWTIFDGAFARGAAAITVHGRTVKQKYVGPSNWEFLAAVKRHAGEKIVIGSGDLFSAVACVAMLDQTGVDGVSVARGAIGNPWIFPCPRPRSTSSATCSASTGRSRWNSTASRWPAAACGSLRSSMPACTPNRLPFATPS